MINLEEELGRLAEEAGWPRCGDMVYALTSGGIVQERRWKGDSGDRNRLMIGNCFRSREDAERMAGRLKILAFVRAMNVATGGSSGSERYYITRLPLWDEIGIMRVDGTDYGSPAFCSYGQAVKAVSLIGAEGLRKYWFNDGAS